MALALPLFSTLPDFSHTGWLWLIGAGGSGFVLGLLLNLPRLRPGARAMLIAAGPIAAITGLVIAHPEYGLDRLAAILIALAGMAAWFLGSTIGYAVRSWRGPER